MNDRIVITRTQIGRAASLVGGVAFVVALGLVFWQGGLTAWGMGALVVGMLGIGLWIVIAPEDFRDWITGRAARYGGNSVLGTLIIVALVVALYGWAERRNLALDMTLSQNFTLSPQVLDVLDRLEQPVQLTGFYTSAALSQRDRDDVVYHLFEVEGGGRFQVVYVDPTVEPVLAERFGYQEDGTAFLTYLNPETGEPDLRVIEAVDPFSAREQAVANALLRLMAAGRFKVYFTAGHGEPDPQDATPEGISGIFSGTAAQGILTETLDALTLAQDGVPADATALVIPGARSRFSQAEAAAIGDYLEGGGRLLVAADALLDPMVTFLDGEDPLRALLAERFGLALRDDLVIDETSSFQSPVNVVGAGFVPHAATQRLNATEPTVFFRSRSIEVVPYEGQPEALGDAGRAALVLSSEAAYGETDLAAVWEQGTYARDADDVPGPLALVAVAQNVETNARVVLTGDADFLRNAPVGYLGNRYLYTDALAWLTEFFEQVEIEVVSDPTRLPLLATDATLSTIFFVTVLLMPGLVLGVGLLVWRRRLRQ